MEKEDKPDMFDKNIRGLFGVTTKITTSWDKRRLNLDTSASLIMKRLEKYKRVYDKTQPKEHVEYFKNVYDKNRSDILRGDDMWLRKGNISIKYGNGIPGVSEDIKIMLSSIYNNSWKLKDEVEKDLEGLPESTKEKYEELVYPEVLLLNLYRIFKECPKSNKGDNDTLSKRIKDIEINLNLNETTENQQCDGLGGMINVVTKMMADAGINPPDSGGMPTEKEVSNIFGSLLNNPKTKSAIGGVFTDLQDCKNVTDVVQGLLKTFSDPSLTTAITESLGPTARGAAESSQSKTSSTEQSTDNADIDVEYDAED